MANHNVGTAADEIAHPRQVRPHLVVLGAGASRAAFPQGELSGRKRPLMVDFTQIVPLTPILDKSGLDWRGKNLKKSTHCFLRMRSTLLCCVSWKRRCSITSPHSTYQERQRFTTSSSCHSDKRMLSRLSTGTHSSSRLGSGVQS